MKQALSPDLIKKHITKVVKNLFSWERYWVKGGCAELAFGVASWLQDHGVQADVVANEDQRHFAVRVDGHCFDADPYVPVWEEEMTGVYDLSWLNRSKEFQEAFQVYLRPAKVALIKRDLDQFFEEYA
jgi:hypothetical protein